jgi:hypothetical protein
MAITLSTQGDASLRIAMLCHSGINFMHRSTCRATTAHLTIVRVVAHRSRAAPSLDCVAFAAQRLGGVDPLDDLLSTVTHDTDDFERLRAVLPHSRGHRAQGSNQIQCDITGNQHGFSPR